MEAATDIRSSLNSTLDQVDRQLNELKAAFCTRYAAKQLQNQLKTQLNCLVSHSDMIQAEVESLRATERRLRRAVRIAKVYVKVRPPDLSIRDVVLLALDNDDDTVYGM